MNEYLVFACQALATVLVADLATGTLHWVEDAYGHPDTPVFGKLFIRPNIVHHHFPRHFVKKTWWQSSADLVVVNTAIIGIAAALGWLTWHVWLFCILAANSNHIHKCAHRSRKENGPIISALQRWRILQNPAHHALHHTDPKASHYCVITNLVNPVLDTLHVWEGIEWVIAKTTGIKRRPDTSVADSGATPPDWLIEFRPKRH